MPTAKQFVILYAIWYAKNKKDASRREKHVIVVEVHENDFTIGRRKKKKKYKIATHESFFREVKTNVVGRAHVVPSPILRI